MFWKNIIVIPYIHTEFVFFFHASGMNRLVENVSKRQPRRRLHISRHALLQQVAIQSDPHFLVENPCE
jgi:hypothetical protein